MILASVLVFLLTVLLSVVLTGLVRSYALKRNLVDYPNSRSLHDIPIPRGGGVAILISVTACFAVLVATKIFDSHMALAWIVCGLGFGLLGWVDDHNDVSVIWRLMLQLILAAAFCLIAFSAPGNASMSWTQLDFFAGLWIAALGIAWIVNLYNFMDGADGFAASESLVVAGAGGVIAAVAGAAETMVIAFSVAGAAAGFLWWNWQPARIFMGDVGSYFVGFQFGALILHDFIVGIGPWMWLILLTPFVVDASLTLCWRFARRERWWQAHRSHIYQLLVLRGWSHANVSIRLCVTTLVFLAPAALIVMIHPHLGPLITGTVYVLAAIIWAIIRTKIDPSV